MVLAGLRARVRSCTGMLRIIGGEAGALHARERRKYDRKRERTAAIDGSFT